MRLHELVNSAEEVNVKPQHEQKLRQANKQQLLAFLKKTGIDGKEQQTNATYKVTKDREDIEEMTDKLSRKINEKQIKVNKLEEMRKNIERDIQGLDTAIQANKEKIKKREEQLGQADLSCKKQRDELKKIQKRITPKLCKQLFSYLEKNTHDKVCRMMEALVGMLRNTENCNSKDVELYLSKQEGLVYKMEKTQPEYVRDSVIEKHFNTIKGIQKSFIDSTDPEFSFCSNYAAFIAWASQYIVLCKDTQFQTKCKNGLSALRRDQESKKFRRDNNQTILDNFNKDGYISFLEREIVDERSKIEQNKQLYADLTNTAVEEQQLYVGYEKLFFQNLEQFVIKKKLAGNMQKQMEKK
ncbi:UNKNOWN [Stylonychia lemnae]|uniref:Uncharacterized protein n=1 Tax=Stylonychia lemnae TaxID=5949 RepID=A0A078A3P8_STYLE|nr:UNKNOWN [Stylonychia lemnae]|eukprot:CDW76447.1 UNKNOWN [Stylonychia lemnae]